MKRPTLCEQLLKLQEGTHYSTKVRQIDEAAGVRRIRMGLKESRRMIENLLNPDHPTPNPETDDDKKSLEYCREKLDKITEKLSVIKTRRRVKK